jgi:FtsH-binding integral membrane protein
MIKKRKKLKILTLSIFISIIGILIFSPFVQAISLAPSDVPRIIGKVATWFYQVIFALAVFFFLLASYLYLTGNPENIKKAHKHYLFAAIGVVAAFIAFSMTKLIETILK